MKIGDKIPMVLEVVRPAEHGELVNDINGKPIELMNLRGDKFWAVPRGSKTGPFILVCSAGDTESNLLMRRAIVDLLECGVGA